MTTQVGWIKFDGDEHFDFRYYRPDDRHILAQIASEGYMPVFVPDDLDESLALERAARIDGQES